jgi:hypothetical protein
MVSGLDWDLNDAVDPSFGARLAQALGSEGFSGLTEVFSPEINWHVPGSGALAGTYEGLEAVTALLSRLASSGVGFELFDTLVSDAHCGMLLVYERDAGGRKLSAYGMWLMHVDAGIASECFCYFEDQEAFEELVSKV